MAAKKRNPSSAKKSSTKKTYSKPPQKLMACSMEPRLPRPMPEVLSGERAAAIIVSNNKWANGTVLHYYFFKNPSKWRGSSAQKQVVRDAFQKWKSVGIGLEFKEVSTPGEAAVRIAFERDSGHWSYLGRDVLDQGTSDRTMNFDNSDNWGIDTAIHEIGHTLGLPHEHQNPNAGIVWDEPAVIADLGGSPNFWSEAKTRFNILRKIDADTVQGSNWDSDSVMHYSFKAGMIIEPAEFQTNPLVPAPGLSARDREWIKSFYPPLTPSQDKLLKPFESQQLDLQAGEQVNFKIEPEANRRYQIQTFGVSDTVMVLFEDSGGEPVYLSGDDDSGVDRNASMTVRLHPGRKYILRVRLYYAHSAGDFAVMMW